MPKFSSKHKGVEKVFAFSSFHDGYTEEISSAFLNPNQLSEALNVKYVISKDETGNQVVTLKKRQGTTLISNSALPSAADVQACTYYVSASKYILATSSKLYYLDGSLDPVEIGSSFLEGVPTFTEFNSKLIIHDGGITKFWDGTTSPVLNTNYGKIAKYFQDEILATGDNATTEFSGTVDNPAVLPSSMTITFTDSTSKSISDDGSGRLTGNVDSAWTGTVTNCADNGSGAVRVTDTGHPYSTNDEVNIQSIVGTTEANNDSTNPTWAITKIDANTYDLQSSTFTNAYTSGGTSSLNALIYSTGAYVFKCDGAPDNVTNVTADYKKTDGCAKSKAGLVRARRLYIWGDADNHSRLTYSEVNDETATDESSGGGYLDVDKNDGYDLLGGLNFETTLLLMKEASLHRVDSYPDDIDFRAEKLTDDFGAIAHKTPLFEGDIVSFLAKEGWVAMHPSQRYGDIQKGILLSKNFKSKAARYSNSAAYTCYNPIDKQLWLALSTNGSTIFLQDIYVANLETGGQISKYKFKFGHTCFAYADGKMLIGGADGNLYQLDSTSTIFKDNGVSYSGETNVTTGFQDWGTYNNVKHNKKIFIDVAGSAGVSFTFDIYRNNNFDSIMSLSITAGSTWGLIYYIGPDTLINTATGRIGQLIDDIELYKRFNYKTIMAEFSDIAGNFGTEILGIKFTSALTGDRWS